MTKVIMNVKQQLIAFLFLLGSIHTVFAALRASSLRKSSQRNQNSSSINPVLHNKRNVNNATYHDTTSDATYHDTTSDVTETRFIVRYRNDIGKQIALDLALKVHHHFHEHSTVAIELESDGYDLLNNHEHIESIDVDSIWSEQGLIERVLEPDELDEFFSDPKNERYLQEKLPYGISMVQANQVNYGRTKAMVCVIDSGCASSHPDFNSAAITGANRRTIKTNTFLYWNRDKRGHGTHISGIVAARLNNNYGVRGMGSIPLYQTRGLDDSGNARESDIIDSINQCVAAGSKVINLSLAGGSMSKSFMSVVDTVYAKNILVVAAAGNEGKRVASYPAAYNKVVSVGAVDGSAIRWAGSNYGPWIEVTAPGTGILSTGFTSTGQFTFTLYTGTSMASPHVAGAAALLFSNFPSCTATQIRYALAYTAWDRGTKGCDEEYGYGVIQVKAAFDFLTAYKCSSKSNWGKNVGDGTCGAIDTKPYAF